MRPVHTLYILVELWFTGYALARMAQRGISEADVRRVLDAAEVDRPDPVAPRRRAYGPWGDRRLYLLVVYQDEPIVGARRVINTFPIASRRVPRA